MGRTEKPEAVCVGVWVPVGVSVCVRDGVAVPVPEGDCVGVGVAVWLGLCVPVGVGEQIFFWAVARRPGYGDVAAHVTPPSPLSQAAYAVARPAAGRPPGAALATACQFTGADVERTSA